MSDKPSNSVSLVQRVVAEIKRDKKRTAILGVVLVVGVALAGKMFLGGVPSKASAAPSKKASKEEQAAAKAAPVKRSEARTAYIKGLHGVVTRDVFEVHEENFTQLAKEPVRTVAKATTTTASAPVDHRRESIETQASRLALQTIMYGGTSIVSIDGQMLRVGDTMKGSGFQVMEIKPSSCVLSKEGCTVELKLNAEDQK